MHVPRLKPLVFLGIANRWNYFSGSALGSGGGDRSRDEQHEGHRQRALPETGRRPVGEVQRENCRDG